MSLMNNPHFARIHAHICRDGHIYVEKGDRGKRYIIEYTNKSIELISSFARDVYNVLKISPTIIYSSKKHVYIARVKSRYLYYTLRRLGANNSKLWRAQAFIRKSPNILINWISAFTDDEGHIDKQKYRVIINSVNYYGVLDIQKMLRKISIDSRIYNYGETREFYRLVISRKVNVCNLYIILDIHHQAKKRALTKICSKF